MAPPAEAGWRLWTSKRMLLCVLTGFSSGLPLYVLMTLVPAWLRTEGVDLEAIGLMSLVQLPYLWKFLWAPLMDRYVPPILGRRRGWALVLQGALLVGIASLGALSPTRSLGTVAALATLVAFASASQDVVLDAFRRELLPDHELGLGNALFVNAYRVSSLVPGSLALILADHLPWSSVFPITGAFVTVGLLASLWAEPVAAEVRPPVSLAEAVVGPFREFFTRRGPGRALLVLAFLLLYKLGDGLATALVTPFYLDVGFSMTEVGTVAKGVGLASTVVGGLVGGWVMTRVGIARSLWLFGAVQLTSILGFAGLSVVGPELWALSAAVVFEYLGVGLGTTAFVAFLASQTDRRFSATQLALFTSFIALPRTVLASGSGWAAEALGWTGYFLLCTALAVPGMLLLPFVAPWREEPPAGSAT